MAGVVSLWCFDSFAPSTARNQEVQECREMIARICRAAQHARSEAGLQKGSAPI